MRRETVIIAVVLLLAASATPGAASTSAGRSLGFGPSSARNCPLVSPPNTGESAPYGFQPDSIEVTFCGNRRLTDAELQAFTVKEQLTLIEISASGDFSQNAYYLRILSGTSVPDRVRQLALNDDVRSVGVVPKGVAASGGQAGGSSAGLPNTATDPSTFAPVGAGSAAQPLTPGALAIVLLAIVLLGLAHSPIRPLTLNS